MIESHDFVRYNTNSTWYVLFIIHNFSLLKFLKIASFLFWKCSHFVNIMIMRSLQIYTVEESVTLSMLCDSTRHSD